MVDSNMVRVWGILPPRRGGQPLHLIYAHNGRDIQRTTRHGVMQSR